MQALKCNNASSASVVQSISIKREARITRQSNCIKSRIFCISLAVFQFINGLLLQASPLDPRTALRRKMDNYDQRREFWMTLLPELYLANINQNHFQRKKDADTVKASPKWNGYSKHKNIAQRALYRIFSAQMKRFPSPSMKTGSKMRVPIKKKFHNSS